MKVLIDENLPKRLKKDFPDHEIYFIREMGWNGKKNGELMHLLRENNFDLLLTFDKNLRYQQNLLRHSITVFILMSIDNDYESVSRLLPSVRKQMLKQLTYSAIEIFEEGT